MSAEQIDLENPPDLETGEGLGADGLPPEPKPSSPLKPIAETTPMERLAGGVGVAAVVTAVAAMIVEGGAIVMVAGLLSAALGPYAYFQQTRLTDIRTLKETHEAIQREVNRLHDENVRLSENVKNLGESVDRLEDIEEALDVITKTQGESISAFADQVQQNREILGQMKKNLKANVLQNIISVVLRSDVDGDFHINDDELNQLMRRIENINGVEVHEDRLRAKIQATGGSLNDVMDVIRNLLSNDIPKEEQIFTFVEDGE